MFTREYAEHVGYEADTLTRVADLDRDEAEDYVKFWEWMFRLHMGGKRYAQRASEVTRKDFFSRPLLCTPFKGAYGTAGWVCAVNGTPPRATLLFQEGTRDLFGFASGRPREVRAYSDDWCDLWDFHGRYLAGVDAPIVKYSPDVLRGSSKSGKAGAAA
jgi:hypothetical protein